MGRELAERGRQTQWKCQKKAGDLSREASQGSRDGCRAAKTAAAQEPPLLAAEVACLGSPRPTAQGTPQWLVGPVYSTAKRLPD